MTKSLLIPTISKPTTSNPKININENNRQKQPGPQIKNLPSIIRGFKSAVTINAQRINPDFAWQPRYYEHIIRDDKSYNQIRNYIIDNPENWCDDDFHEQ